MRVYAQKPIQLKQEASLRPGRLTLHTIRNQATLGARANAEGLRGRADTSATTPFAHDFSRIPVCSKSQVSPQAKLTVNATGDIYEQEADRVAERVTNMAEPQLQRTCACGGGCPKCQTGQTAHDHLQTSRVEGNCSGALSAPPIVHEALHSSGELLDPHTREFMESRFGHDFSHVRVHTDEKAAESSRALHARAYTVGRDIVFGTGQYTPGTQAGRRLIAHELTHVIQQDASPSSLPVVQRQLGGSKGMGPTAEDMDMAAEREYAGSGAPKAQTCGRPSWCPPDFCSPYPSQKLAEYHRAKDGGKLMLGISLAVNSRVVPLWREYLMGGSAPKNLTGDFGKDFTNSPTTKKTTTFLYGELKKSIAAKPPSVPKFSNASVDIATLIPTAIAEINDPASANQMNFNIPKDIPGNLAGGIGNDQTACPSGAMPSPFNDQRLASGTVEFARTSDTQLSAIPLINYTVKDTIDLCPGDCGTKLEQLATVPLSQFEATGISGDVPFTVEFPAPPLGMFTVSAPLPPTHSPAPSSKKP